MSIEEKAKAKIAENLEVNKVSTMVRLMEQEEGIDACYKRDKENLKRDKERVTKAKTVPELMHIGRYPPL